MVAGHLSRLYEMENLGNDVGDKVYLWGLMGK